KDIPNDFTYAFKADGYVWSDAYQAKESDVVVTGFLNETINQFYAGLGGSLDVGTQKDSLYSYNNSILRLNPYLKFQGDNYKIDAGLNLAREFGFSSRVFIFPAAKLELQVIPKYIRIFAEVRGDVNKTSLKDLADENPFIEQDINIKNSVDRLDLSLGLKGMFAPGLGFKATIFRNSVKNMPMFVSDFTNTFNKFAVIYDGGNATVTGFNGELDFKQSEDLDIFGRVEFRNYQLATEPQAWNLPKFKLTAGTTIHLTKQLSINGSVLFRGQTYDRTMVTPPGGGSPTNEVVLIDSFADLSGGAEYKINSRFSIFGQVNNILNTTNQVWLYYPNYGFNIFGGVGVHF
ncbi:MAG TPA: TonB-dependent receptor, partial [Mucilaginibacter sp.]|nr:TonB-dependent receptor [Mucilaginibacter sp.]